MLSPEEKRLQGALIGGSIGAAGGAGGAALGHRLGKKGIARGKADIAKLRKNIAELSPEEIEFANIDFQNKYIDQRILTNGGGTVGAGLGSAAGANIAGLQKANPPQQPLPARGPDEPLSPYEKQVALSTYEDLQEMLRANGALPPQGAMPAGSAGPRLPNT